jgi:hypothetical protein
MIRLQSWSASGPRNASRACPETAGVLTSSKPEELTVSGTLITDALGRELDGDDDRQAGSDFIATISGRRIHSHDLLG